MTRRPALTVAHVALILPWITAVVAARLPIRDNSFLWHVTAGRLQLDLGEVLTTDPFSFTFAGEAWRTQSWLIELAYGWFDRADGLTFVTSFVLLVAALTFAFVLVTTGRMTGSVTATAIVGVMTAWLSAAFLSPRPVLPSFLFLSIVAASLHDRRLRWVLPIVTWVWASVHGSFVLGVGLVILAGLWQRRMSRFVDAAIMLAAATLTAHGLGVWEMLIQFAQNQDSLNLITEWATPDLTRVALIPLLGGILLLIWAGTRGGMTKQDMWVVAPFLVFAFTATRAVFPAWIVLAPFAGLAFVGIRASTRVKEREQRILAGLIVVLLAFPFMLPVKDASSLSPTFPIEAAEYLTASSIFHDDFAGGYLIYRYGTARPVFIDDRAELYGADHLRGMIEARNGVPGWRDTFSTWSIEQALVRPESGLAQLLAEDGWAVKFESEDFVVMEDSLVGSG